MARDKLTSQITDLSPLDDLKLKEIEKRKNEVLIKIKKKIQNQYVKTNKISIEKGEIFGLLGPNGAGKTTTVEMIEGLRKPDSGSIRVCEIDVLKEPEKIKELIGAQLQSTTIYDQIKIKEVIDLFGSYYDKSVPTMELLELVSLTEKKNAYYRTLSGGQKQRVAMALALVNDPIILFLDEPTTGLDPQARRNVWKIITDLKDKGKTIILTTHYMEEAEQLCKRVGIMDRGNIIALDKPASLITNAGIDSTIEFNSDDIRAEEIFRDILNSGSSFQRDDNRFTISSGESSKVLKKLTQVADNNNINIENISVRKATLEDVFLKLTGKKLRE
jgi:ABC-2 type transport system ATP-binding protein